tara:strand:- start:1018 stop:1560 length:543 start_codon:yes stop_codon:yes gene_type:complete
MALAFIAEIDANSVDTENLVFTAIPQTFTSLRLMGVGNTDYAVGQSMGGLFSLQFNEETTDSKHAFMRSAADYTTTLTNNEGTFNSNYAECGSMSGTAPESGYFPATYIIDIYNYKGVAATGSVQYFARSATATASNSYSHTAYYAGTYGNGTTPITSLQLKCSFGNWLRFSKFSLYGRD